MPKTSVYDTIERIAEALVMLDPSDPAALASLHDEFKTLGLSFADIPRGAAAAGAAAGVVESLLLQEIGDEEALNLLAETAAALQQMIRPGADPAAVALPVKLPMPAEFAPPPLPAAAVGAGAAPSDAKGDSEEKAEQRIFHDNLAAALATDQELVADFIGESMDHLDGCDNHLMELEKAPGSLERLDAVFRGFHTIKGVAGFLNLHLIGELAHSAENMFDATRDGKLAFAGEVVELSFLSVDLMKRLIGDVKDSLASQEPMVTAKGVGKLRQRLEAALGGGASAAVKAVGGAPETMSDLLRSEIPAFLGALEEHLESANELLLALEKNPVDKDGIDGLFRCFHTIKGDAGFLALARVEEIAHAAETLLGRVRSGEIEMTSLIVDLFFRAADTIRGMSGKLEESCASGLLSYVPENFKALLVELNSFAKESPAPMEAALAEDASAAAKKASKVREMLKVDAERLDHMVETIGELVIAGSMITHSPEVRHLASAKVIRQLRQLDKITRELQAMGMSLRMVPLRSTFQKMARLVRDLSQKMGKEINFTTIGEETELDKNVVDKIGDPLVHMLRNSIDHGVENTSEERLRVGKPPHGRVVLRAFHKGGNIHIEVEDDGRGLDRDAIIAKAKSKGLVDGEVDKLSDREIYNLVFLPGFSTATQVTAVSGRGVGMDVVRKNIEALRGQVEITSVPGKGSTFVISLPITLAIIDGMVVRVGQERLILPTLAIEKSVNVAEAEITTVQHRGELIKIQEELVPIFRLDRILGDSGREFHAGEGGLVVIISSDGLKAGIVVDEIIGQQQVVIKSLGEYFRGIQGISGGAIMSDGEVGLILDISSLMKIAHA